MERDIRYGKRQIDGVSYNCKDRWVDLSDLPRKSINYIDWDNSSGHTIKFRFDDVIGDIYVCECVGVRKLRVKYKNRTKDMRVVDITRCKISELLGIKTKDFKIKIGENIIDNKRNLTIIERAYRKRGQINDKWYKYRCNKCGNEDWIVESALLNFSGCNVCCNNPTKDMLGVNTIWDKARWMCDLGVSEEDAKSNVPSSINVVSIVCPCCHKTIKKSLYNIYKNRSIGCACGDGYSYAYKYLKNVLDQVEIRYCTEVKYKWNKYYNPLKNKTSKASIDFVIYKNGREIPLEVDGDFHRKDNKMSGQTKEVSRYIDKQRDENCLKHLGEETIRITDEGDIKENILNSKLATELDLSNINWGECNRFALNSIKITISKYYENNTHLTQEEICNIFKISVPTLRRYLKQSNVIRKYSNDGGSKPVYVYSGNMTYLFCSKSRKDCSKDIYSKYGINIDSRRISESIKNGSIKNGFIFRSSMMEDTV